MSARRYTLAELEDLPTLSTGWTDNLKIDTGTERVWLARVGIEDGMPYDNQVTIERYTGPEHPRPYTWITVSTYPAAGA